MRTLMAKDQGFRVKRIQNPIPDTLKPKTGKPQNPGILNPSSLKAKCP